MLDDISFCWFTNTGTSSSRSYWEVPGRSPFDAVGISIPVAVTIFPGEIYRAPRSWAEQNFHNLIYWNEVEKGGHFAAWEQPELLATEIQPAFRTAVIGGADGAHNVRAVFLSRRADDFRRRSRSQVEIGSRTRRRPMAAAARKLFVNVPGR